jgi:FkbM family methyltransferase
MYIDLKKIASNFNQHATSTFYFNDSKVRFEEEIRKYYQKGNFKFKLGDRAPEFNFPYLSQGKVDSANLFGMNELILFSYYEMTLGTKYSKVLDLGANIGLHTIFMTLLGSKVASFEPDPITFQILSENVNSELKADLPILINAAATPIDAEYVKFYRVSQNRTGSHVVGSRKSLPYGGYEELRVPGKSFSKLLSEKYDLVKVDVEGLEAELLCSVSFQDFPSTSYLVEVGNQDNGKKIWDHVNRCEFNAFSQKNNWKKVHSLSEIPFHHSEGTLFITSDAEMSWGQ